MNFNKKSCMTNSIKRMCALVCSFAISATLLCGTVNAEGAKPKTDGVSFSAAISNDGTYVKKGDVFECDVTVPENGDYQLKVTYKQKDAFYSTINVKLTVDGVNPSKNNYVSLAHVWTYDEKYEEDVQGNQIAPVQNMYDGLCDAVIRDSLTDDPYVFPLEAGAHKISLTALEEEFYVCGVTLFKPSETQTYEEYIAAHSDKKNVSSDAAQYVEAEKNAIRSEKSILVSNDRTSVAVTPYDANKVRYNVVGGDNWAGIGQWIEWNINVEETGMYSIMLHTKQNTKLNDNSYRKLTINGEVPFKEAEMIGFAYERNWKNSVIGNGDTKYKFFFEEGKEYTIRLTACAGETKELVERVSQIVTRLNQDYLEILMITGSSPDAYRDYKFTRVIPETLADLEAVSKELKEIENEWYEYAEGGASLADIQQMYQLIDKIIEDPDTLAARVRLLTSYISSLQTWVSNRQEQPLYLDYIYLCSPDEKITNKQGSFWKRLWHHIYQFFSSFTTDYSAIGNMESMSDEESITVWLGADAALIADSVGGTSGRDQSQIVTRLTTNDFVAKTGISTKIQLVNAGTLLTAVVAGIGPDVAVGLAQGTPVNYALRNSIIDLAQFDDIDEVLTQFNEAAVEPFKLEGGIYALPQSQTWNMLFYRKDILENMNISIDSLKTWDSIMGDVLPLLQINYLEFGVPNAYGIYLDMLYQRGGKIYSDDHMTTLMDSPESVSALTYYTNMYLESGLPLAYSFADRFRNGSMPIGIAGYTTYNQLSIYAPEIEGMWGMLPIPGIEQADGTINNVSTCSTEGCGIFKEDHLEESWEFLKWWVSTETQLTFSQELETLLGSAGRNPTANIAARNQLGWSDEFKNALQAQASNLVGVPEVAGGYYTPRYFSFAFTDIVYNGKNVNEVIIDTKNEIDAEIANKTEELLRKGSKK